MWRFSVVFIVLFTSGACAQCVSSNDIVKCARLPEGIHMADINLQDSNSADDVSWSSLLYDHQSFPEIIDTHQIAISGTATLDSWDVVCTITSPFYAEVICAAGGMPMMPGYVSPANSCAEWKCDMSAEIHASALPNDVCPDGFYTVPYDVSCGVGLVEVSDIPQCDTDTSGEFCLIGGAPLAAPCAAGVTTLRTGTGLTIPLWADKNTTPALHVRYNGTVCYINLEPGNAPNSINVEYGGVVYHTVN